MTNKKLKILMLNYEFPPLGGGGGVASYKLAKGFVDAGHQVDYVTTWFKDLASNEIVDGINVYRVKVIGRKELPTATMLSLLSFPNIAYKKCIELFKLNDYDFINTQFAVPTGPVGVWLSKRFKKPNILSLHGGDIYDPSKNTSPHRHWYVRNVVRWVINNSTFVVAQSSNTKNNAIKYYNPKNEISIIPLPYELIKFKNCSKKELGLDENKKYIIGVGRMVKRKAFDDFIKVIAKLPENVYGIIIGEGPEKEFLENLAKELNITDRIIMPGFVTQEKKFQYLDNCDIYLLSSLHEGFGIVLQEAMQVGLPLVATNNGGQVDIIEEGRNGYLIEVGNIEKLTYKTNKLLNNSEEYNKIRNNNLNDINNYGLISITESYLRVIRK